MKNVYCLLLLFFNLLNEFVNQRICQKCFVKIMAFYAADCCEREQTRN